MGREFGHSEHEPSAEEKLLEVARFIQGFKTTKQWLADIFPIFTKFQEAAERPGLGLTGRVQKELMTKVIRFSSPFRDNAGQMNEHVKKDFKNFCLRQGLAISLDACLGQLDLFIEQRGVGKISPYGLGSAVDKTWGALEKFETELRSGEKSRTKGASKKIVPWHKKSPLERFIKKHLP